MGFKIPEKLLLELDDSCSSAVSHLQQRGHKAKLGTRSGMKYPQIVKGKWRAFLLLDTGMGWTCPLMSSINYPHWDWFVSQNTDMTNSSLISGLAYGLIQDLKSTELMVDTLEYIVEDPCLIPNAAASEQFKCPKCESKWETVQSEPGVIGRLFAHSWGYEEPDPSEYPTKWSITRLEELFGKRNYE
jgi:hypothetical protein